MDGGFGRDQWNNIDGMIYFILFDGTEQIFFFFEHICAHFSLGRNMVDCQSYVKQWTKFMIYVRRWLAALLSSAHRISAQFIVSSCVHF